MDKILSSFSLSQLEEIQEFLWEYSDLRSMREVVQKRIQEKKNKEKSINEHFTIDLMERIHIFNSVQLQVLKKNQITNLQQLIDCDLDSLIGITPSLKREYPSFRLAIA